MANKNFNFATLCKSSEDMNEYNDCSVKAVAAVTTSSYKKAHKACERRGRKGKRGMHTWDINYTVCDLGYDIQEWGYEYFKEIKVKAGVKNMTTKRLMPFLKNNTRYLIFFRGHVAGVYGGELMDWTEGRKHVVTAVYEVKKSKKLSPKGKGNIIEYIRAKGE